MALIMTIYFVAQMVTQTGRQGYLFTQSAKRQ